jgi:hypothetical protein
MKKQPQPNVTTKKKNSSSSSSKKTQRTQKVSTKKKVLIGFTVLLLALIVTYFSIAWYQGYVFRNVEKKMDKLTQEIIEKIGEPISQTKDQSCGYASAKYGKGNLGCGFINNLSYEVNSPAEATKKILVVQSIARGTKEFLHNSDNIEKFKDTSYSPIGWTSYKKPTTTNSCSISYYYKDKEMLNNLGIFIKNDDKNFILIRLSCGTDPLRPIFPIKE